MKNKLHTICHPERNEGSQNTTNHVTYSLARSRQLIPKSHSIIYILYSIFLTLFSIPVTAQNYDWDWAINGGGSVGESGWYYRVEQIFDVQVGSDNNYYFIGRIKNGTPQLGGQPVTVYGKPQGGNNIFIFSTTCDGQVRWSQAIGGGLFDDAYNIALDSNNNVYLGANVTPPGVTHPVHFSPTEIMPTQPNPINTPSDYYKRSFLVKYSSNGQFVWKKAMQGITDDILDRSEILDILIDSNDVIHFIVGFTGGTHLDNNVTVPSTVAAFEYYLTKYDTSGNYVSSMQLPIVDGTGFVGSSYTFRYDEPRNRYYIGSFRSRVNANEDIPLTYDGTAFTENAYILAIDAGNGSEIWRREMASSNPGDNRIYDLVVDQANGDLYIGGKLSRSANSIITIKNPKNPTSSPYTFNFSLAGGNMPFIAKLNSGGTVQWARTPSGYNWSTAMTGDYWGFGMALRYNEVAFATMGSHTIWDGFSINRPQGHQSDPLLMRFNKQTGAVIGMHDIEGSIGNNHMLTAVAVDNDGNYVVGGCYQGNLFTGGGKVGLLGAIGRYDFFVAKLGASTCGTAVSTDKFNNITVNVYPNPTTNIVNIETQETLQNYEVYNVLGQQIQKGMFNSNNQVNLHGATAGTYFIKVTTTQGSTATLKVIKK